MLEFKVVTFFDSVTALIPTMTIAVLMVVAAAALTACLTTTASQGPTQGPNKLVGPVGQIGPPTTTSTREVEGGHRPTLPCWEDPQTLTASPSTSNGLRCFMVDPGVDP